MIHFITGLLDTVAENLVVVECGGVGFEILVPLSVVSNLPQTGNEVKIYTYTYVREDALQLYGFLAEDELEMFKLLITVNGIGPKGALGILSVMDVDALRFAIMSDDAKSIAKAPGIGAKTASKLILELKDKLDFEEAVESRLGRAAVPADLGGGAAGSAANDAIQALVALGYTSTEAVRAVKKVELTSDMTVEDILKAGLKNL